MLQRLPATIRSLVRRPVFTVAALVTLALGIGLNSAVYSAVYALLLRPLPGVEKPDRLVQLYRSYPGDFQYGSNSIPHWRDVRAESKDVFSGVALWSFVTVNMATQGGVELGMGQMVSENYFDVLGVRPILGRGFLPEEGEGIGAHPVAVLSYDAWRSRFGGDPSVVGREVRLNGMPYTIVGVAPDGFYSALPLVNPLFYAPLTMQPQLQARESLWESRGNNQFNVIGRLRSGVTAEQARSAMNAVAARLRERYPDAYEKTGITVVRQADAGIHPSFGVAQKAFPAVIMGVVALLLLLACVNVANLFLARAQERRREMGIRLSVGATRWHLVRQLLGESLILSFVAALLGLGLARVAIGIGNGIRLPIDVPVRFHLALSGPVLLFTLIAATVAGLLFGLAPALQASNPELTTSLKSEPGTERAGAHRSRLRQALVVSQIALSLLLLASAGLFLRALQKATTIDKGFVASNLALTSFDPSLLGYDSTRAHVLYSQLLERVRALPGVQNAALAEMVPLGMNEQDTDMEVPGYTFGENERRNFNYNWAGTGYFETMGMPLVEGRGFRDEDMGTRVAVVNRRFEEHFWPGGSAVGHTLRRGSREYRIVGVVPTGKYQSLGEDPLEFVWFPIPASYNSDMTLHVRTTGDPERILPAIRREVAALDPMLPVFDAKTMTRHLGLTLMPARLAGIVLGIFGLLGLFLAAVGTYGVIAYSVAQRTREIAIRMALGAARGQVVRLILGQGARLVGAGLVIGLAGALLAGRLVHGLLYGVSGADPFALGGVCVVLLLAALAATWLPAWRAASVDPMRSFRAG